MISAKVDTTSKYSSAFCRPPARTFMSPAPAMPSTTVQKMIGLEEHLHERDEAVAERLERHARVRRHRADGAADENGEQHPEVADDW
jgi:hypothetical protein